MVMAEGSRGKKAFCFKMGQLRREENCHAGERTAEAMSSLGEEIWLKDTWGASVLTGTWSPSTASGRRPLMWVQRLVSRCACANSLVVETFSQ